MGSGKTQTGYFLSKKLGYKFVDLDMLIEESVGMKIKQIFTNYGEDYFRKIESETLRSVTVNNDNIVISTGGGAPCFFGNMDFMNKKGITVYLKMPASMLADRLKDNKEKRPVISRYNEVELRDFIVKHLQDREEKCYSKSQVIADMSKISLEQLYSIISYTIWVKKI
jgi:shikimate kinase